MINYTLNLLDVTKIFGRRLIFDKINYEFSSGSVYGLAGKNGSGKSTLAKIIAGILSPTRGKVSHKQDGEIIIPENLHDHLGFVSPYLVLYDEFTAGENLVHFSRIRGDQIDNEKIKFWLDKFNLYDRRDDLLKGFSSGMKQRMKIIFALLHEPRLIIFDEPTSNLDNEGKDKVYEIINEQGKENTVIVASNEDSDLALCGQVLQVEDFKNKNE